MGKKYSHVTTFQSVSLQDGLANLDHFTHSKFEHRLSILVDVVHFLVHRLVRGWVQASASRHVQGCASGTIYFVEKVDETRLTIGRRFHQHGAGTIAKDHTGGPVGVIDNRGHHVSADDQNFFVCSCTHELHAGLQGIDKSRASGRDVKTPS